MKKQIEKNKELLKKHSATAERKAKETIEDYKKFAIKGNIVDLAIGVVIGSAFTNIINTLVSSLITPLLSIITNKVDIASLFISLSGGTYKTLEEAKAAGAIVLNYGAIFNAVLNFFIVSIILFIVFKYVSKLKASTEKGDAEAAKQSIKTCPYCKSNIDITATRCAFCTSELGATPDIVVDEAATVKAKTNKKKL